LGASVEGLPHRPLDIDAQQFALVRHRAAHVGDELGFLDPRVAFVVAALTTTRADFIALPSLSSTTATPSAGQSSAEPVVTFM